MKKSYPKIKIIYEEFLRNLKSYFWVIIVVSIYLIYFAIFHQHETNCIIKRTIGFPCPGCGMSRASVYFLTFHYQDAFTYHPFVFLMPLIVVVVFFKRLKYIKTLYSSKLFWISLIIIYIAIYVIRMILYFPDTVPMDYYNNSFLQNLFT